MSNVTNIINDTVDAAAEVDAVETHALVPPVVVAQKKAPARWRGQTFVYVNKEGERYAVFHRNSGGHIAWQHPYEPSGRVGCVACS